MAVKNTRYQITNDTYLDEGDPAVSHRTEQTMRWGEETSKPLGMDHPFMEVDLFNDTPIVGTQMSPGDTVIDASLFLYFTSAAEMPLWSFPLKLVSFTGADAPEWASTFPNWDKSANLATMAWAGATENSEAGPVQTFVDIPDAIGPKLIEVTPLITAAVASLNGIVQLVGLVPGGPGTDTDGFGTPEFYVEVGSIENVTAAAQVKPFIEVSFATSDSVTKLVDPNPRIRQLSRPRLVGN